MRGAACSIIGNTVAQIIRRPFLQDILSPEFIAGLRAATSDTGTLPLDAYGGAWNPFHQGANPPGTLDHGTSHLVAVDANRMAVSLTTTINTAFGAGFTSRSTGIIFNNEMDDFSRPDAANGYPLHPFEASCTFLYLVIDTVVCALPARGEHHRCVLECTAGPHTPSFRGTINLSVVK